MSALVDLIRAWLYHLANVRNMFTASNKREWIARNVESLIILAITVATFILVLTAVGLPWGATDNSPIQPPNKFRLVR